MTKVFLHRKYILEREDSESWSLWNDAKKLKTEMSGDASVITKSWAAFGVPDYKQYHAQKSLFKLKNKI